MPVFDYRFVVEAPLAAVRDFHRNTSTLKKLTPPPTIVQLHEIEPLAEGSISNFTLWVGPIPLHWKAVHRDVNENGFTDIQTEGPAEKWEHTHTFLAIDEHTTEVREQVVYEHASDFWGLITRVLFSKASLQLLFAYRRWATRRALEKR